MFLHEQRMFPGCHHEPWAEGRSRVRGRGTKQGRAGDTRGCRKVPQTSSESPDEGYGHHLRMAHFCFAHHHSFLQIHGFRHTCCFIPPFSPVRPFIHTFGEQMCYSEVRRGKKPAHLTSLGLLRMLRIITITDHGVVWVGRDL